MCATPPRKSVDCVVRFHYVPQSRTVSGQSQLAAQVQLVVPHKPPACTPELMCNPAPCVNISPRSWSRAFSRAARSTARSHSPCSCSVVWLRCIFSLWIEALCLILVLYPYLQDGCFLSLPLPHWRLLCRTDRVLGTGLLTGAAGGAPQAARFNP